MLDLDGVKLALRIKTGQFDDELEGLLAAATLDLKSAGIAEQSDNALYDHALRMYARGNFEPSAPEAEACRSVYDRLKATLKHASAYMESDSDA